GQGYLSALATRAIIFIEADNPAIGLMAFIGIGMDEVSTCEITVKEGDHVKKGQETGMFHFGGSSHCLLFRNGVKLSGFPQPGRQENVPVRSKLATTFLWKMRNDEQKSKTYSSRDSHVVTHRSTNLPFNCLCMAERTGCPVFS
ncbi:hypothetical protein KCV05_g22990, partial [Aureobasidium melanogenum]